MRFIKENWPHVLLIALTCAISSAFALGFAWAVVGNRVANAERRLDEIDAAHVAETRWQVQQHTADIAIIQHDARHTESEVALINTRLSIIEAKLDAIAETLKKPKGE
jgi:hypothetical protein